MSVQLYRQLTVDCPDGGQIHSISFKADLSRCVTTLEGQGSYTIKLTAAQASISFLRLKGPYSFPLIQPQTGGTKTQACAVKCKETHM